MSVPSMGVLLSEVYGLLWFLECAGCDPTVKAALIRIERFMEGVSWDVAYLT